MVNDYFAFGWNLVTMTGLYFKLNAPSPRPRGRNVLQTPAGRGLGACDYFAFGWNLVTTTGWYFKVESLKAPAR